MRKYLYLLLTVLLCSTFSLPVSAAQTTNTDSTQFVVSTSEKNIAVQTSDETEADLKVGESLKTFARSTGVAMFFTGDNWKFLVMMVIACLLLYLAIVKKFEPLLLLPIAFGMLLTNLPGAGLYNADLFAGGQVHWAEFTDKGGLLDYLYLGVKLGIYPCIIFIGIGAMTDFGSLLANPKSLLLGAAAQMGIFFTYLCAVGFLGFAPNEAASIAIIGGADGPTAIYLTSKLAPELLGPIAVAAYSYMALVPVIQPPIMRALTTKKERLIEMKQLRIVTKTEKIIFPVVVTVITAWLLPASATLIGCLMFGNIMKESGVVERLSKTVQNELMNIVTVLLGITVGATATAGAFLNFQTLKILSIGIIAFGIGTGSGVLLAKLINVFSKEKINPLIGSAGVSAVPMAARVSQNVGQEANPRNYLLMHAMGPNVAGVIGSAVAAGILLSFLS
ncbi:MAG TPA: sodium ion-translocating decarboxylase subunit beta [Prolixibacteraceae bacterium]|nr:sodium ion-translocating decarboxylase subunit beta [Prolixibacteraceae bacterium]